MINRFRTLLYLFHSFRCCWHAQDFERNASSRWFETPWWYCNVTVKVNKNWSFCTVCLSVVFIYLVYSFTFDITDMETIRLNGFPAPFVPVSIFLAVFALKITFRNWSRDSIMMMHHFQFHVILLLPNVVLPATVLSDIWIEIISYVCSFKRTRLNVFLYKTDISASCYTSLAQWYNNIHNITMREWGKLRRI